MNRKFIKKTNRGFSLIEMMVAISIFSIVVMISMTAILSVVDSNKKAQSLKSVMNNLNFALETMTRSIKIGDSLRVGMDKQTLTIRNGDDSKTYKLSGGRLLLNNDPITAPEVVIDNLKFFSGGALQPSVVIVIQGTMKINEKISSEFSIQTTVTQRKLGN